METALIVSDNSFHLINTHFWEDVRVEAVTDKQWRKKE